MIAQTVAGGNGRADGGNGGIVRDGGALADLLARLAALDVRLSAEGGRLGYDAPDGTVTPDLRAAILAHKGAILRLLAEAPADRERRIRGELPAGSRLACNLRERHMRAWRYADGIGRYVCRLCEPDTYAAHFPARLTSASAPGAVEHSAAAAPIPSPIAGAARQAERYAALSGELAAWGEAHAYPALAFAWRTRGSGGSSTEPEAYKTLRAGAEAWGAFTRGATWADLLAACHAAGILDTDPAPQGEPDGGVRSASAAGTREPSTTPPASAAPSDRRYTRAGGHPGGHPGGPAAPSHAAGEGAAVRKRREPPRTLAVLDTAGLWIARPGATSYTRITEGVPLADAGASAADILALARRERIDQVWIHPAWARAASLPDRLVTREERHNGAPHPFIDAASAAGWDVRPMGIAPWLYTFQRGTWGAVALAFPHLDSRTPWADAADGRTLLAALMRYRAALGYDYRRSPGATGTGLIRDLHVGNRTALDLTASAAPSDFPMPARVSGLARDLAWIRPLTAEEAARRYVHSYDKNALYLGACSSLALGFGVPEHRTAPADGALTFDGSPGYWRAAVQYDAPALLPHPFLPGGMPDRREREPGAVRWYLAPALALAAELGARVDVREAWVWPESHRVLTSWYERMRGARTTLQDASAATPTDPATAIALRAVKATYTQTIGWLDGGWMRGTDTPEDLYRPDWRHAIIAQAAANQWRNLAKVWREAGAAPFAVGVDCWYFTSDEPDPVKACPVGVRLGAGLGQFKVKDAAVPLADVRAILAELDGGTPPAHVLNHLQIALGGVDAGDADGGEE